MGNSRRSVLISLLIVLSLFLMASCSKLGFFYHRMDWLIPHYIDDYVELNDTQGQLLEKKLATFLRWHCQEEIPAYVELVAQWRQLVDSGKLTSEQYRQQRQNLFHYFDRLAVKTAQELKPLAQQLDEKQLRQFIDKINEENQNLKEDFIDQEFSQIQSRLESRLIERYERWTGDLNEKQLNWIRETSFISVGFEKARYEYRRRWLTLLEQTWQNNKNMDSVADFLYYTVTDRERYWSNEYRLKYFDRSKANEILMLKIMNSLTPQQSKKLKQELASLQAQFQELVCQ